MRTPRALRPLLAAGAVALLAAAVSHAAGGDAPRRSSDDVLRGPADAAVQARRAGAAVDPVTWCGSPSATNLTPELELSSPYQVHVVYAIPSDGADQFSSYASRIATDLAAVDAWWQRYDPSRAPRWDLFAFPGCASKLGQLDIGSVRLPHDSAYYLPADRVRRLTDDLDALAGDPTKKTLLYYDGPVAESRICGETDYLAPEDGGRSGVAVVWLGSICPNDVGQGAHKARTAVHELVHNLGALVAAGAPHGCPDSPGHVCDSSADLIYPFSTFVSSLDSSVLDMNNDDYYAHPGTWWDVQDSRWLSRLPQFGLSLSASVGGAIRMTSPAETSCEAACAVSLDGATPVTPSPSRGRTPASPAGPATAAARRPSAR